MKDADQTYVPAGEAGVLSQLMVDVTAQLCGATALNSAHRLSVAGQYSVAILGSIPRSVENGGISENVSRGAISARSA